ncbi:hypothetical protein AR457_37000 [Streptomyces agglomeratus]|uniref:Type I-E CRISPR-associated protein Cas6/Cse3/CasE n=1 Tax=Streptomyces agglomeratus TaxID=285458 RepID=A0A1E5NYM0_9ACTN|nr:type I-E CRISPR-associated protein Cas6/Cse3/CasE [Streptomyces agglomeratus]OEJ21415.1 hypothetical protein AS594_38235 [Streptomyces agglomeratus]OEJ22848.1 hypothetical protein AR457_37000 [Streptomyces agglomeratus]OEJ36416.1 hypothetical protein BGK72_37455 [Streptomyces agglomeratus]OEJ56563.1 hypothetical protein BGM19_38605 [Streptomyces agglomeratus]
MTASTHDLLDIGLPDPQQAVLQVWRSALTLAPLTTAACTDAHRLHQLVERGLGTPETTADRNGRILFTAARNPAVTNSRHPHALDAGPPHTLLVQTPSPPDWTALLSSNAITGTTTQGVLQTWATGDTAEIRTVACPLVSRNDDTGKRRRAPLISPDECGAWLRDRLHKAGCKLAPHDITMEPPERIQLRGKAITLRLFRATATIYDPHAFTHLLATGLGHNRAWGAGLVLARPTVKERQSQQSIPAQGPALRQEMSELP